MREAVIVSTARTGITKAFRGGLNMTHGAEFGGAAAKCSGAALRCRSRHDRGRGDRLWPSGRCDGRQHRPANRHSAPALPVTSAGMTVNRFCSSGLQAVALASHAITQQGSPAMLAGGIESITLAQGHANTYMAQSPWILENKPAIYLPMIDTADIVAARYGISREAQDEYALSSQQRTAEAQEAGPLRR